MTASLTPDSGSEQRKSSMLLDVLIRAGLVFALAALCYQVFAPFLTLMVWALILAVAMYPLHQMLARKIGGKQGLAATLIALIGAALIVAPTRRADGFARRLGAAIRAGRPGQYAADPGATPGRRGMADRRQEDPCVLVEGALRPAGAGAEHAAEDRRPRESGARLRRGRGGGMLHVPGVVPDCRRHHGIRRRGRPQQRGDLRPHHEPGARARVRQAVDGDHSCGRAGRHRRRPDPGHRRRRDAARGAACRWPACSR